MADNRYLCNPPATPFHATAKNTWHDAHVYSIFDTCPQKLIVSVFFVSRMR